jgi:hypothetical protein
MDVSGGILFSEPVPDHQTVSALLKTLLGTKRFVGGADHLDDHIF